MNNAGNEKSWLLKRSLIPQRMIPVRPSLKCCEQGKGKSTATNTTTGYYTQEEDIFLLELSKLRDRVRARYDRYPTQIEIYHMTKTLLRTTLCQY